MNPNKSVHLIPVPAGLSAYLLRTPLRGQEPCQKHVAIPDWGRSVSKLMKPALYCLLFLAVSITCKAEDIKVKGAEIKEYGIFIEETGAKESVPTTAAGYVNQAISWRLKEQTETIEAKVGVTFGVTYVIGGAPADAPIRLRIVLKHPPLKNPETGKVSGEDSNTVDSSILGPNYDAFTFEHPWEAVPGKWIFQSFYGSKLLTEKSFTVIPAKTEQGAAANH